MTEPRLRYVPWSDDPDPRDSLGVLLADRTRATEAVTKAEDAYLEFFNKEIRLARELADTKQSLERYAVRLQGAEEWLVNVNDVLEERFRKARKRLKKRLKEEKKEAK